MCLIDLNAILELPLGNHGANPAPQVRCQIGRIGLAKGANPVLQVRRRIGTNELVERANSVPHLRC